ncbi:helix-turn-helix domain-containing protein [Clostridium pasteurianum]|uniref:Putative transcriptional regulator n=1 Tax=Clostridium pasteurianum BC1 TaxID=86416 RepID=R4K3G4_CLOPA|nr:helix-turn-helix domain-containing protein [Clostridium pasteurianum]AGK97118.1 putative transcriptional regulator [Clostridium pasteurianum BC1]
MKKGEILDKVYKSNLPSRAKQIMFYLINRANTEGTCFPSVRTIAKDCGVSERTVQRTMKVIFEAGFVIKENRYRDNGGQSSNLYKLQIELENKVDNQPVTNKKKTKEEKNGDTKSIETVTFHDYIDENEIKENLNSEKQTAVNILVQKIVQGEKLTIKTKCHPMQFQQKAKKLNICEAVTQLKNLCHGVSDNLYPP